MRGLLLILTACRSPAVTTPTATAEPLVGAVLAEPGRWSGAAWLLPGGLD